MTLSKLDFRFAPRRTAVRSLLLLALTAGGARAQSAPPQPKILVYTRNFTPDGKGYVHENIPFAVAAIARMGAERRVTVHVTDDPTVFTDERLKPYVALVFANSNNEAFATEPQKEAFRRFIQGGGGFVGIHSASGSQRDWPYYWSVVGGRFVVHPRIQTFTVRVADTSNALTRGLPAEFEWTDEFYFHGNMNPGLRPILLSDRTKLQHLAEMRGAVGDFPNPTPLAWSQTLDGGRQVYIALGHQKEHYADPILFRLIDNAIGWVMVKR